MRNTFLILKREYLETVRTKSFIISTLLLPALMFAIMVLPSKLALSKKFGTRHIAVVCANPDFARAVQWQLQSGTGLPEKFQGQKYQVDLEPEPSETTRAALKDKVVSGKLDGYVWLSEEALRSRKIDYVARETSDFLEAASLQAALKAALLRQQLIAHGVSAADADMFMKDVQLQTVGMKRGKETRAGGSAQFLGVLVLTMMLYMTVLLYGMAVMRSVLEEKTSRVMEVVLSSATAKELMAGKVLGVGGVGLTQIAIWAVMVAVMAAPGMVAAKSLGQVNLPISAIPAFAVFFLLGYLLYSAMFAALGAMVNSEQEAQQWQFFITLPIIVPILMMTFVIRQPNAALSLWMSLVPFFAPILMYMRIVVQTPPFWQIALCVLLLVLAIWGVVALCSRIYRVGILMYGKKPTLPEIVKWVKYA